MKREREPERGEERREGRTQLERLKVEDEKAISEREKSEKRTGWLRWT